LCFGWIDSTLKPMDPMRYAQRFTPRKRGSNWSTPNLIPREASSGEGLMTPAGAVHLPSVRQARAVSREASTTTDGRDRCAGRSRRGAAPQ
jgi:hypothetical protein